MNRLLALAVASVTTAVGLSSVWYAHQKLAGRESAPFFVIATMIMLPLVPAYIYAWRRWSA